MFNLIPEGRIKTVTISKTKTGKYYVSLTRELLELKPYPKTKAAIGIDLGIASFAAFSNGEKEKNNLFRKRVKETKSITETTGKKNN